MEADKRRSKQGNRSFKRLRQTSLDIISLPSPIIVTIASHLDKETSCIFGRACRFVFVPVMHLSLTRLHIVDLQDFESCSGLGWAEKINNGVLLVSRLRELLISKIHNLSKISLLCSLCSKSRLMNVQSNSECEKATEYIVAKKEWWYLEIGNELRRFLHTSCNYSLKQSGFIKLTDMILQLQEDTEILLPILDFEKIHKILTSLVDATLHYLELSASFEKVNTEQRELVETITLRLTSSNDLQR